MYAGLVLALSGAIGVLKPIARLALPSRRRAVAVAASGIVMAGVGLALPAGESRVTRAETRLDAFMPAWQFREFHSIKVGAPPERAFDAIRQVKANEIFLFNALTWIRRGGRPLPPGILNAGDRKPLIRVATENGFVKLAEDFPRELVIGAVVMAPPGARGGAVSAETFRSPVPEGYAVAVMNFFVTADGPTSSVVTTETRVFASGAAARRRFAAYWRVIYPGSALIRRMWLRAVQRRATASPLVLGFVTPSRQPVMKGEV